MKSETKKALVAKSLSADLERLERLERLRSEQSMLDIDDVTAELDSLDIKPISGGPQAMMSLLNHLIDAAGFFHCGCGCVLRVAPGALGVVDTESIASDLCLLSGTCIHGQTEN